MKYLRCYSNSLWILISLICIGSILRFTNLAAKTPSTIEIATLIFSIGNRVSSVPLNQVISLDTLLQTLQPNPEAGIGSVIQNLLAESTHPPVYFILTHLWLNLFPTPDGLVSLWAARALAALFGIAAIPAIYYLGWLAFRSRLVAQISAAIMAVSPYSIFIAQEARHYTLPVLLIIASLCCLVIATRSIENRTTFPIWLGLTWVGINSLGIAVHYFFSLVLAAEGLVVLIFWIRDLRIGEKLKSKEKQKTSNLQDSYNLSSSNNCLFSILFSPYWLRLYAVVAGTLIGGLVWIPLLNSVSDSELTRWIYQDKNFLEFLEPIPRMLAWIVTMLALLPVEGVPLAVIVIYGLGLGIFIIWLLPILSRGIRIQLKQPETRLSIITLGGFVLGAIALFLCIIYGLGADLTLAARYHFVYFPAIIVLLGASLAQVNSKKVIAIILIMSLLGGLTVVSNFGFQKSKRSDILANHIIKFETSKSTKVPVLIAMVHKTHAETRAAIGLSWELQNRYNSLKSTATSSELNPPQFLLSHKNEESETATDTLLANINQLPKPVDLWLVNFSTAGELETNNCVADSQKIPKVVGYKYKLYHCS